MKNVADIIVKPLITEKAMDMLPSKRYAFKVASNATKPEIAAAVEKMFGVEVAKVNVVNVPSKPKRLGVHMGQTSEWKKAIVTLAPGETIEIFANDGEATFTTHAYPTAREFHYTASAGMELHIFPMSRSVTDEFVV